MIKAVLVGFVLSLAASAGEYAVLDNGFRVYADSHEIAGSRVRLYTSGGIIEFPAAAVVGFEQEEVQSPAPAGTIANRQNEPNSAPPAAVSPKELVSRAARRTGLPEELLHSIAVAESGYRVDAVSPKGAIGLMQLMPGTARELSADPYDPEQNAEAGARYLGSLLLKYRNDDYQVEKAVAAYNAGPGAVDRYKGVPPYRETRNYVEKVINSYQKRLQEKSAR